MLDHPSVIDLLVKVRAAQHGSKDAVIDPETRITYRELDTSTRELATVLVAAGVGKGTRVGLLMANGVRWVQVAVALMRIGAVLVPLSTLLQGRELVTQLRVASVQWLISVTEFRGHRYLDDLRTELAIPEFVDPLRNPQLPALRHVWTPDHLADGDAVDPAGLVDSLAATVSASDPMVVMFTSGSNGPPKGVVHTHGNALGAVHAGQDARCIDSTTRLYLPMPLFWVGGFAGGLISALLAGATLVTEAVPQPESTLRLLERERVNLFRGWPDQAEALARRANSVGADLSALRPGSLDALLPPHQRAQPGARAKLFGMTESFGPYCGYRADTDMPQSAWGSCGKPFDGMEVLIVDSVIQIRGPHTLRGICRRSREDIFTADGWYPTGDLGHFDENGFMFYHGRADDMFKVSGATVYPVEVEAALRSIPDVQNAAVTNVSGTEGDRVGAVVVCKHGTVTAERLREECRKLLSAFKVPTLWLLVESDDEIPRGSTGKVDIGRIRALLTATE